MLDGILAAGDRGPQQKKRGSGSEDLRLALRCSKHHGAFRLCRLAVDETCGRRAESSELQLP